MVQEIVQHGYIIIKGIKLYDEPIVVNKVEWQKKNANKIAYIKDKEYKDDNVELLAEPTDVKYNSNLKEVANFCKDCVVLTCNEVIV